ncbi:MAG: HEAT repeat domain-containing protein [Bacteroidales bacterium]|jgi:DNA modification methylase|nr:HEAT repeat domain-containing protein [Bacteroidales bacterium]
MPQNNYSYTPNPAFYSPLTKEFIKEMKLKGNGAIGHLVEENKNNSGNLLFILENLGYLPTSFDSDWLFTLLNYNNEQVRLWVVKNIGKLQNENYIDILYQVAATDTSTAVKREAISSIGRMRSQKAKSVLFAMLTNEDPKIICQAIRGLLVFKGDEAVDLQLKGLVNHENEMVRTVIYKEYFAKQKEKTSILSHAETYPYLKDVVVNGDVRDVLKYVPDESIHLTFTSPPYYNARDYSIYPSYEAYLAFLEEVFLETYRVTKEGRFLIVNTSPVIVPRISRAHSSKRYPIPFDVHHFLVQMGWEFIDDIIWCKPEYSVKNRVGGFAQHRKPLAYKPNPVTEYLMVYRKQTEKLIDWNIHQYDSKIVEDSKVKDGYETTNVWQICPKSDKVHSAIFPVDLCKRVVEYYSFKGDLVFDPFGGSGTLGRTAKSLGRKFFLTEQEPKYVEYMKSFKTETSIFKEDNTKFLTLEQFKQTVK